MAKAEERTSIKKSKQGVCHKEYERWWEDQYLLEKDKHT